MRISQRSAGQCHAVDFTVCDRLFTGIRIIHSTCDEYWDRYGFLELRSKFNIIAVVHVDGNCFISPDGSYGGYQHWSDGYGMRRPEFEKAMAVAAARVGAEILMDARFLSIGRDSNNQISNVVFKKGGETFSVDCKIVIACDSVYSKAIKYTNKKKFDASIAVSIGYDM